MLRKIIIKLIMYFFHFFGIKNRVVFVSFDGLQYSCNPKAISIELHKMCPSMEQIWLFRDNIDCADYVKKIKKGSMKSLFYLSTSKFWIDNCTKPTYYYKNKRQIYIQTWHGDCSFKRIEKDSKKLKNTNKKYYFDYAVAGSEFGENYIFKKCFEFKKKIFDYGCPRNDVLINGDCEIEKKVRTLLKIGDKKILLYAPTFRDSKIDDKYYNFPFNVDRIINELKKTTNKEWVFLYRGHHVSNGKLEFSNYDSEIIDVTNYPDMADILLTSDILISDYSSCSCDFILQNKFAILYFYDYTDYDAFDRELLYKPSELPFKVTYTEDELVEELCKFNEINIKKYCSKIKKFYGIYETGLSSMKICEFIMENADLC